MDRMLRKPDEIDQAMMAPARIVSLDRARTFIILLVLLHHSVINYTYFGRGDPMRWLGFDLVVLFNDSFFMAFMFFVSGLFVRDSLVRKGWAIFLRDRAWRLGVPFLISIFVLMPIAYYPTFLRYHLPETTDFNFLHFWWRTLTVGPAGARPDCRRGLVDGAACHPGSRPADFCRPQAAADGLRHIPDRLDHGLSADAPGIWRHQLAGAGPVSASHPDQPYPALPRVFLCRRRGRSGKPEAWPARRGRRTRKTLADLARLCVRVLPRDPHPGLRPPQLGGGFRYAAAAMANQLRPRICRLQRRNGLHVTGDFLPLYRIRLGPARCNAALGLRHLSLALHLHRLAAIRRL